MRCVSCGCDKDLHVRADGHCLGCSCPKFIGKWPEAEAPKEKAKPPKADAEKDK